MSKRRRYQFLKLIASGGFGDVYLCKEVNPNGIDRLVAVKLLKSQWSDNKEVVARLQDEARLLALLRHRNIINVFDLTSLNGRAAIIMEYLEGIDLSLIISVMKDRGKRTPLRVSLEVCAAAAAALDAAYNQPPFPGESPLRVIHRDIKPSNIMIDVEGMVKVLDFGVAYSQFEHRASETSELQFGSLEYMAPERLIFEPETPASDLYSLGLTLFECILGERFGQTSPKEDEHHKLVEERLHKLSLSVRVLEPVTFKKELMSLLMGALHYNPKLRISAVEFSQRARSLARTLKGSELIAWAENAIPKLKSQQGVVAEGSLRGRYIEEDIQTDNSLAAKEVSKADSVTTLPPSTKPATIDPQEDENSDDETEIRTKKPISNPVVKGTGPSFMDVGALNEEEEVGTEVFGKEGKKSKEETKRGSYFDQEETVDVSKEKTEQPTEPPKYDPTIEIEDTFVGSDFPNDPYDESVESAVVQPVSIKMPEEKKSSLWIWIFLSLLVLSTLAVAGFVFKNELLSLISSQSPEKEPVDTAEKEPVPVEPKPPKIVEPPEDSIAFSSLSSNIKKVIVKCDGQKAESRKGTINFIVMEKAKVCTVTFLKKNNRRVRVKVKNVKKGLYQCLLDEKETCARAEE